MAIRAAFAKAAVLVAALALLGVSQAEAQGFFESLFGGVRRAVREAPVPAPQATSFSNPFEELINTLGGGNRRIASSGGPGQVYCVRTCDGRFFPVSAAGGAGPAEMCKAFCPAAQTKIYSGGGIDHAVASDGSRYADMPNAFAYREKLVQGCSCNGKTPYGLATLETKSDPTLRQGDIVAEKTKLSVYNGGRSQTAQFTPIASYAGMPKDMRAKLSQVEIQPSARVAEEQAPNAELTGSVDPKSRQAER